MKKVSMNMSNVREKDQLNRMYRLQKEKRCFFCDKNYVDLGASRAIYESNFWYIKKNDYPYKGIIHHYLIVSRPHIKKISEISGTSWSDLLKSINWLEKKLKTSGYSVFVRSGNMQITGATLDHLHFHMLVGVKKSGPSKLSDNILVTLGHKNNK